MQGLGASAAASPARPACAAPGPACAPLSPCRYRYTVFSEASTNYAPETYPAAVPSSVTYTDAASGAFTTPGLPAGRYTVRSAGAVANSQRRHTHPAQSVPWPLWWLNACCCPPAGVCATGEHSAGWLGCNHSRRQRPQQPGGGWGARCAGVQSAYRVCAGLLHKACTPPLGVKRQALLSCGAATPVLAAGAPTAVVLANSGTAGQLTVR